MDRVADAFVWPFRDPDWPRKLLIIALTLLIPIVGAINGLGWMLATLDRLRAGEEVMAPATLGYLGRGFRLFVVQLAWGLAVAALALVIYLPALLLAVQQGKGEANGGLILLALFLNVLAFGVATIGALAATFASPAYVLATDRGGISAGLRVREIWRRSRANVTNTLIAGLMLIAASFVSSLGSIVCLVGIFFTAAYALAMQAWIFRSFESGA
ncbi:MAG TPA: DUF4013 domain-containing protein [Candidatus Dormibacteraeota bacterium]|nr:DUF4013 domain-containing protein [Candidatus Dormibacteraeota bacterium]